MNICIVAGARPNFIKVAPIVKAIERSKSEGKEVNYQLVYAGALADTTLEQSLFDDLQINRPDVCLGVDCENLNELTGRVMSAFEDYLNMHQTDVVIVVDDLASTMAVAIVAKKQGIRLAHLVAGTRSFDINMPKEINRLVIDGLSDLLFTAGIGGNSILSKGGTSLSKVYMVGNILMDTMRQNRSRLQRPACLDTLGIRLGEYIVFTLNRRQLIADHSNLKAMVLAMLHSTGNFPILAPLRAEAAQIMAEILGSLGDAAKKMKIIEPMGYLEFGYLTAHAKGIVTDSGNVAEEATFNGVPCITLNSYTEHIETVKQGTNVLVGENAEQLAAAMQQIMAGKWKKHTLPERWDGRTADRIVQILLEQNN